MNSLMKEKNANLLEIEGKYLDIDQALALREKLDQWIALQASETEVDHSGHLGWDCQGKAILYGMMNKKQLQILLAQSKALKPVFDTLKVSPVMLTEQGEGKQIFVDGSFALSELETLLEQFTYL